MFCIHKQDGSEDLVRKQRYKHIKAVRAAKKKVGAKKSGIKHEETL